MILRILNSELCQHLLRLSLLAAVAVRRPNIRSRRGGSRAGPLVRLSQLQTKVKSKRIVYFINVNNRLDISTTVFIFQVPASLYMILAVYNLLPTTLIGFFRRENRSTTKLTFLWSWLMSDFIWQPTLSAFSPIAWTRLRWDGPFSTVAGASSPPSNWTTRRVKKNSWCCPSCPNTSPTTWAPTSGRKSSWWRDPKCRRRPGNRSSEWNAMIHFLSFCE